MRSILGVCLIAAGVWGLLRAQNPTNAVLLEGVHVEMATASRAAPVPEADEESATVVTVTADSRLFVGVHPVEIDALGQLTANPVYVKADERAPFQKVLTVLDKLSGHSVVLLTAPTVRPTPGRILPPYGVSVRLGEGTMKSAG